MKKVFIGIDFSKLKFDAAIYLADKKTIIETEVFDNEESGFKLFLKWVNKQSQYSKAEALFCGEHTGNYSIGLTAFLCKEGMDFWLVSGLEMKLTQGIKRSKTDKVDACNIAEHAYRYQDKAVLFKLPSKELEAISDLLSYRARLLKVMLALTVSAKEMKRVKDNDSCNHIFAESHAYAAKIKKSIADCEKRIKMLVSQNVELKTNYDLVTSVAGIGMINAALILVATGNFTLFNNPRQFGCYCGVVPFEHNSGSSVRGKTRVSKMANKEIKATLGMAVLNCMRYDPVLKDYYQRKKNEGKNKILVRNNMKNKLIHIIFAVVKTGKKYEKTYNNPLKQAA